MRKRAHYSRAAGRVARRDLLPDYRSHVIESNCLAELYYLGPYRDNFVSAVVNGTSKLVSDIYAQTTSIMENTKTLVPNEVQIVYVILIAVIKTYLTTVTIVL